VYDVAILGGGLAGLTAALQLSNARPDTRIAVIEKRSHPVPDTAHKVGESVAEVAAIYLKDKLGLDHYMHEHQHRKMGLRWFCTNGDNRDISQRVEFGSMRYSPLYNFHVDRGKLENHIARLVADRGVEFIDGVRVKEVSVGKDVHTVHVDGADEVSATWVVDCTGRQALLRHQLGLGIDLHIDTNACWFRIPYRLMVDEWCDDAAWRDQVPTGTRWKSTISFVGKGYWVWVINLGSGSASVGVVADPRWIPFERIRRYDALREWLQEVEPQLASHLPESEADLLDFMKRRRFAQTCTRSFSRERWCVTGEAACFVDPLYSTGLDFTAVGNTLAVDLITRALDGAPDAEIRDRVRSHNRTMAGLLTFSTPMFEGQLCIYGDPQATGAKFIWDNQSYFSIMLNMFKNDLITDPDFGRRVQSQLAINTQMNSYMQERFREWSGDDWDATSAGVPLGNDNFWGDLFYTAAGSLTADELEAHVARSIARLHTISREMVVKMCEAAGRPVPPDPFAHVPLSDEVLLEWASYSGQRLPFSLEDDSDITWHVHPAPLTAV
jgi:flavin-dependent dehydrogenase